MYLISIPYHLGICWGFNGIRVLVLIQAVNFL
jgi:hypothetical protein